METTIPKTELAQLVLRQLQNFFPIGTDDISLVINSLNGGGVLEKLEINFRANPNKYYSKDGKTFFNPFHSGQYCIFLYFLSNEIWKEGNTLLADKIYYLNKIMNGLDMFYEIELPEVFMLDHPVGSVLGRAKYSDGFSFCQNCTVGNNKGIFPILGKNFKMSANSTILGNCKVGDNVILGAGALVKDQDLPSDCIVFGQSPNLIIKYKK